LSWGSGRCTKSQAPQIAITREKKITKAQKAEREKSRSVKV